MDAPPLPVGGTGVLLPGRVLAALAVSAIAKDIRGFRLTLAISSTVIAFVPGRTMATWMSALFVFFHTSAPAIQGPSVGDSGF